MAARTSKKSKERQVPYKILNDLSSVDLLYEEKKQKKKNFEQISWYFCLIYSRLYFSMRGPGSSLFPVKHCWIRKTNMATVSRLRRGFSFNAFPVRSQGWAQITDSTKQK